MITINISQEEKETAIKLYEFLIKELGENVWENEKFLVTLKDFSKKENSFFFCNLFDGCW